MDELKHRLELTGRKTLVMDGVTDVDTFNDGRILMKTNMGNLWVKGTDLQIRLLNLEEGRLEVEGKVNSLEYTVEKTSEHKNFFRRIFK